MRKQRTQTPGQSNQPASIPTLDEIYHMTNEIRSQWTSGEERRRRTIEQDRHYTIPFVSGVEDDAGGPDRC